MRTLKPTQILFLGSSIVCATLIILFLLVLKEDSPEIWQWAVLILSPFIITFLVFYFLIKKFIDDRIKLLYRSIKKGKMGQENISFSLKRDLLQEAEKETEQWTIEQNNEISKLKEREEFRREFLGNLAHELKTPVFAIQGYILTLLDGGLEDSSVNTMFLERASKATDRMTNILEDLDQITKLEIDQLKLEYSSFDIVDLAQEIFDTFEIKARDKNITLSFSRNFSPTYVRADRGKIAQVLTNLINNSISYGNVGGKTVLRIFILDETVTIEVSDNGPGISESHLPRLFERFYRVEKSRNRHEGGSGLGLAIVKHIIESHDQTINVRSTVDVGSTFAFTLDKSKPSNKENFVARMGE